jgi:hypothetical protein
MAEAAAVKWQVTGLPLVTSTAAVTALCCTNIAISTSSKDDASNCFSTIAPAIPKETTNGQNPAVQC